MNQTFQSLHSAAPLRFDDTACRTLRGTYGGCRTCAQACPAGVLAVDADAVTLKDGCLGCGRCMSACPAGALRADGFDAAWQAPGDAAAPLRVDCWKATPHAATGELRVPCLGGLSAGRLLELWHAAGSRGLFLMDRGWCRHCSAGVGGQHAATSALALAQEWLIAAGVAKESLPRLVREPLPVARMSADIPDASLQRKLSRRNFFHAVVAQAVDAAQASQAAEKPFVSYRAGRSVERVRLIEGVTAAARRSGRPVPASLFAEITLDEDCEGHGVCARICPTGALSLRADPAGGGRALVFDAAECMACGCCARACPAQALRIDAAKTLPAGPLELRRWTSRECEECGDAFVDGADAALCPLCRKSRGLANDAFDALYRASA